jgi:hypothetical protein
MVIAQASPMTPSVISRRLSHEMGLVLGALPLGLKTAQTNPVEPLATVVVFRLHQPPNSRNSMLVALVAGNHAAVTAPRPVASSR